MKHALALATLLVASPAGAQQLIQPVEPPPSLVAALHSDEHVLDLVRAWPVNWTPAEDLLVQATYAFKGGNAVADMAWYIVNLTPEGPVIWDEFDLPGAGIESVSTHPQGAFLVVYEYRDGDARCCPSGRHQVILTRPSSQ